MLTYIQSREIKDYTILLDNLYEDFGSHMCHTILCWCKLMKVGQQPKDSYHTIWEVWIIKQDDNTIGICGLYSLNKNVEELWLGWFGIIPEFRFQKLGNEVIDYLKETAINMGATKLMSYVGSEGKPLTFYQRNGFEITGTVGEYIKENNMDLSNFESEDDYVIKYNLNNE